MLPRPRQPPMARSQGQGMLPRPRQAAPPWHAAKAEAAAAPHGHAAKGKGTQQPPMGMLPRQGHAAKAKAALIGKQRRHSGG